MYKSRKPYKAKKSSEEGAAAALPYPVLGAVVEAIEAHTRKAHMYRIYLKLELDENGEGFEDSESDFDASPEFGRRMEVPGEAKAAGSVSDDVSQLSLDWNDEVDALISGAKTAKYNAEAVVTVHEDTLVGWRLLKGRRLDAAEYEKLKQEEQKEEAYRSALYMLETKARTTAELSRALKRKGYEAEIIAACVERLQARRFVDDAAYAKRFAEQRASGQRKGRMLIRQELMQRGVGRADVDRALEELDSQVEESAALSLARKKWPSTKGNDRERKMKLLALLMRRGYPSGIARTAVQQAIAEAGDAESDGDDDEGYGYDSISMED
ncbi:regulatory protein RecX [Cohnella endophytica]|uniref:Regulatory protein RecX n=1 Tax=Cohnella endophytica TaxID=2419778 RepID=A0A494Y6I1_9BACL|nr:regulatory protein RecX [Cohnella endophytica]RKP55530.1 regulatory protein RecX [Cohnella endophytica]